MLLVGCMTMRYMMLDVRTLETIVQLYTATAKAHLSIGMLLMPVSFICFVEVALHDNAVCDAQCVHAGVGMRLASAAAISSLPTAMHCSHDPSASRNCAAILSLHCIPDLHLGSSRSATFPRQGCSCPSRLPCISPAVFPCALMVISTHSATCRC